MEIFVTTASGQNPYTKEKGEKEWYEFIDSKDAIKIVEHYGEGYLIDKNHWTEDRDLKFMMSWFGLTTDAEVDRILKCKWQITIHDFWLY